MIGYAVVTAAYWAFMLTDGALRMLVLLYFHTNGFDPISLAFLFLLYEFMGMVTNLGAGWIATRFGLNLTLYAGLALQIATLGLLSWANPTTAGLASILVVMGLQGLAGVAKDLTKMSAKSAVKALVPEGEAGESRLLRWVARLTGSKNAIKGLGFFVGAGLLQTIGFSAGLWVLVGGLVLILFGVLAFLPATLSNRKRAQLPFSAIFSTSSALNQLSLARVFLFGARDVWFVVGVPLFFYAQGWTFAAVGTFMAAWVIGYGAVQGATPNLLGNRRSALGQSVRALRLWGAVLVIILLALSVAVQLLPLDGLTWIVAGALFLFGAIFALNSTLHSFLVLAYAKAEDVALDVGFYYMSNAGGRLMGALLSGVIFQSFGGVAGKNGLLACLLVAALFCALAWAASLRLPQTPLKATTPQGNSVV
ncbi:MAG: MFS transporter [Kiloniella sp.]|nr:MFS transporter [Kiloniella sp.]